LRAQVRLATATDNVALLTRSSLTETVAAGLRDRCEIVADALAAAPDAVLFAGGEERALEIRQALAAADGPIVPMLIVDARHPGDPTRLVFERTLTINTTASGGNASLLSLAE
jgi:RHH-type proline utilization regulon transcriptional repressor/proline dehydrogenase/delta 1-pyrroline-5-carboxylate dehydrogenase